MYDPIVIANYFIEKGVQENDPVTHMKLQKLLYFAEGWYMALSDDKSRLLRDVLQAWQYGPVYIQTYQRFRKYGAAPILQPESTTAALDDAKLKEVLDFIWKTYGVESAVKLSAWTHAKDSPWDRAARQHQESLPQGVAISLDDMKEYFGRLLKENVKA